MITSRLTRETVEGEFPKLMINQGGNLIVLMTSVDIGTVLLSNKTYRMGYHSETWNTSTFSDYDGAVTLSNTQA